MWTILVHTKPSTVTRTMIELLGEQSAIQRWRDVHSLLLRVRDMWDDDNDEMGAYRVFMEEIR